jgi:hypothetical protein
MEVEAFCRSLVVQMADEIVDAFHTDSHHFSPAPSRQASAHAANDSFLKLLEEEGIPVLKRVEFPELKSQIVQLRSVQQHDNRSCGYRSLHNAALAAAALKGPVVHRKAIIRRYSSTTHFWTHQNRFKAVLKKKVVRVEQSTETEQNYFWSQKVLDEGVMERTYLDYLLRHDKLLLALGGDATFTALTDFGLNTLMYNYLDVNNVIRLERVFRHFRDAKNYIHCFILGQTNHFVTLVAHKHPNGLEICFFDSMNRQTLEATDEDLRNIVEEIKQRRRVHLPHLVRNARQENWYAEQDLNSLQSCRFIPRLIHDCIVDRTDIRTALLELNMRGFNETFNKCMDTFPPAQALEGVLSWLNNYFPPAQVEANLLRVLKDVGIEYLSPAAREYLQDFLTKVVTATNNFTLRTTDHKLNRFYNSMRTLQSWLNPVRGKRKAKV